MTDPSSDFLTANQSRVRSLRRSLQPRRGDQSLIALDEAGDVSIEFARYRSPPKPKRGSGYSNSCCTDAYTAAGR